MSESITVVSGNVEFKVILTTRGDAGEPLVKFYDTRFPHTEHGQFVSDYYAKTLLATTGGLALNFGVPDWSVDAAAMDVVRAWLRRQAPR